MASTSREELLRLAKLAEQDERFEDVIKAMKRIVMMGKELTAEERRVLSMGYTKLMAAQLASLCVIDRIEASQDGPNDSDLYQKAEMEMEKVCSDAVNVIDNYLLPTVSTAEGSVFYNTMKGDCCQFLVKSKIGSAKVKFIDDTMKAYQIAEKTADKNLCPTNTVSLHIALKFSRFCYEILYSQERASEIAKQAFDEAISSLNSLDEGSSEDSLKLMKLLKDNLKQWNPKVADATEEELRRMSDKPLPQVPGSVPRSGFKGKVIFMSGPMPGIIYPDQDSKGLPPKPLYPSHDVKRRISSDQEKVLLKLGKQSDERIKRKLRGQLSYLSRLTDSVD